MKRHFFISYRRQDASASASSLRRALLEHTQHVAGVFFDTSAIEHGADWRGEITRALEIADTCLVVIGQDWLAPSAQGQVPRLLEEGDVVAFEVRAALARPGMKVIPVLVEGASWEVLRALPEPFMRLANLKGPELRASTFDDDLRVFVEREVLGIGGANRTSGAMSRKVSARGAALASVVVAAVGTVGLWQPWQDSEPETDQSADVQPMDLELQFHTRPKLDERGLSTQRLHFVSLVPRRSPMIAERASDDPGRPLVFRLEGVPQPQVGFPLVAQLERQPTAEGFQLDEETAADAVTQVCLQRGSATPSSPSPTIRLKCTEGRDCLPEGASSTAAAGGSKATLVRCGTKTAIGLPPPFNWLPSAFAQANSQTPTLAKSYPGEAVAKRPQPGDWLVPPVEVLRAQRKEGGGLAKVGHSEFQLKSGPLPALAAADEVALQVKVNGHRVWFGTLPAWAYAQAFDAKQGLNVSWALENLDAAGVMVGREKVELTLLFLKDKQPNRTVDLAFDYTALRTQKTPQLLKTDVGELAWTADYCPGSRDQFQLLLAGDLKATRLMAVQEALKKNGFTIQGQPVVGVLRPPNPPANAAWGLALGLSKSNGQVNWTFDEEQSLSLCRALRSMPELRRAGIDPTKAFRREVARSCGEDAIKRPSLPCAS